MMMRATQKEQATTSLKTNLLNVNQIRQRVSADPGVSRLYSPPFHINLYIKKIGLNVVKLGCMQALSSFSCHTITFQVAAKSVPVSVSCRLVIWVCTFLFVYIIVNGLLTFAESCLCFYIRRFQIFKLKNCQFSLG